MNAPLKFTPPAFRKMQSNLIGLGFITSADQGAVLTPLGLAYTDRVLSDLNRGIKPPSPATWLSSHTADCEVRSAA